VSFTVSVTKMEIHCARTCFFHILVTALQLTVHILVKGDKCVIRVRVHTNVLTSLNDHEYIFKKQTKKKNTVADAMGGQEVKTREK